MTRVGTIQVTDTLALGGLERVAVNVANALTAEQFRSHLCVTRSGGPLEDFVAPHVRKLFLKREGRFSFQAIRTFARYLKENEIRIIHAHGTSLFISVMAAMLAPRARVIWHDHFGRSETETRPRLPYWMAARRIGGVIAVNETLARWARRELKVAPDRVWYVPNFVCEPKGAVTVPQLPGIAGQRIVCVANFRPEKDHLTLLSALKGVRTEFPDVHLILVGSAGQGEHAKAVQDAIASDPAHVSWLGSRNDVPAILRGCDIGVLSSASEGLPLALIEYGMAGLPSVATNVGQCAEVLEDGQGGVLVPPFAPTALAAAIIDLLRSAEKRARLAKRLGEHVRDIHSESAATERIRRIYERVLDFQVNW